MLVALRALDVASGVALTFTLLVRSVVFLPITVLGLFLVVFRYGGLSQLARRPAAERAGSAAGAVALSGYDGLLDSETTASGALPGAEIVNTGIADLEAGRDTPQADAVLMAATRLRAAGAKVPPAVTREPAAHRLYARLARDDPRNAHSRYNAIVRRVISFARASERARGG
jgi:hypothetical protein